MKKGFLVIISLVVFGLAFGTVYTQEDSDVQLYERIILKNIYGEFDIACPFAVIWQKGTVPRIVIHESHIEFTTIPFFVAFSESKDDSCYSFGAILFVSDAPPLNGVAHFQGPKGNKIKVDLNIETKGYKDKPLNELKVWQFFLKQAYDERFPVIVRGRIMGLKYTGARYTLIIDVYDVEYLKWEE